MAAETAVASTKLLNSRASARRTSALDSFDWPVFAWRTVSWSIVGSWAGEAAIAPTGCLRQRATSDEGKEEV